MDELTPRERFLLAFEHKEADRVPIFDTPNNPSLFVRELGKENYYSEGIPHVRLSRALGMDACFVPEGGYTGLISRHWAWESSTSFTDELGVGYRCNETSWPLAIPVSPGIQDRNDWNRIVLPDPHASWRTEEIKNAVKEAHRGRGDDIAVVAGMRSAFSVLYISMGLSNLSMALYDDPGLIVEMAEALCDFWTESAVQACELGADAVFIANDMGLNNQTILSPDDLRTYFFPSLKKQVQAIKQTGVKVILHSCGNVNSILSDIVDTGVDALNNLQVIAGMDIERVKKEYGDKLTLIGNVDCTNIMTSDDPHMIESAVIETIRKAASGGGHILATDHSFHKGIPLRNVDCFLVSGKRWGRYPLNLPED